MQTLKQLNNNELKGIKKLTLCENLSEFPEKIFDLADSLEFLDLSNNNLSTLPSLEKLTHLKIAFFSFNNFTEIPNVFKKCTNLYMLGFKANKIKNFAENILPLGISWLILTDNKITQLPNSIGDLTKLQKFPLAGNVLTSLPNSMQNCKNLELLRLSANNLQELPSWLYTLPKLSWLAFSGNPCVEIPKSNLQEIPFDSIILSEELGQGASGVIHKAFVPSLNRNVALKMFKGTITSDGYAIDEMNTYMTLGEHQNLIGAIARLKESDNLGILLDLIPNNYKNLGFPPNFETCTQDTFQKDTFYSSKDIYKIINQMLSVLIYMHTKNIMHGDFYAHNILIDENKHCYLGDLGASSFYKDKNNEKIEVRAFGCLIEDLLNLSIHKNITNDIYFKTLSVLAKRCITSNINERPFFHEINLESL